MQKYTNGTKLLKGAEVLSNTPLQLDYVLTEFADLENIQNPHEGKTHLILNDGSGEWREWWYINGRWQVKNVIPESGSNYKTSVIDTDSNHFRERWIKLMSLTEDTTIDNGNPTMYRINLSIYLFFHFNSCDRFIAGLYVELDTSYMTTIYDYIITIPALGYRNQHWPRSVNGDIGFTDSGDTVDIYLRGNVYTNSAYVTIELLSSDGEITNLLPDNVWLSSAPTGIRYFSNRMYNDGGNAQFLDGKWPTEYSHANVGASTGSGTDITTPDLGTQLIRTHLQTFWGKMRQLANVINALPVQEIGNWTPTSVSGYGSVYSYAEAYWYRVGNMGFISCKVTMRTDQNTSEFRISGLPRVTARNIYLNSMLIEAPQKLTFNCMLSYNLLHIVAENEFTPTSYDISINGFYQIT